MAKNNLINIRCFGEEIGRLGYDENARKSFFQYHPDFLNKEKYINLFPKTGILKRVAATQVFTQFHNSTFRGIPPQIADSLPDMFGNLIFKKWLESKEQAFSQISILEQLAYVGNRGMGALEYFPRKEIPSKSSIHLGEIVEVLKKVLDQKESIQEKQFNTTALLNIFKIGTSAGGVRPKILIAENKKTGEVMPGDLEYSDAYKHYIVKLALEEENAYQRELVEYSYYKTATSLGIQMMPSKLIDNQHFATERFDRQSGQKQHVLTATGITGWDFKEATNSTYENLFDLALFLKIPRKEIVELYRRMIFNVVFCNHDDHLKNHSFIYNQAKDTWNLSPAYDLTFSLNPLMNFTKTSRALSINGKRVDIELKDVLAIAENYTIRNPKGIIQEIQEGINLWGREVKNLDIAERVIESIRGQFQLLI